MAKVKRRSWDRYSARQAAQRKAAANEMMAFAHEAAAGKASAATIARNGSRIAVKHGRSSAALACAWYERVAAEAGVEIAKATPVVVSNVGRIAVQVNKAMPLLDVGDVDGFAKACARAVESEVKRSASRTMRNNAKRDGAEYAWVPQGAETCAFCITLASNGWQTASSKTARGEHEDHIHPNCECEFAVRFDKSSGVEGYDPGYYENKYEGATGKNSNDKINSLRRSMYANDEEYKMKIQEQHRDRYAALHPSDD